jgi:hypothetical protein
MTPEIPFATKTCRYAMVERMKTKIALVLAHLLTATTLFAQTAGEGLTKEVTKEACAELSKLDFSKQTADELKVSLGLALVKVMGQHEGKLKSAGINTSDPKSLEKLAMDVGMRLVTDCPAFYDALSKNPSTVRDLALSESSGRISGKLLKVVGGEFTHLQIEDSSGKIEKLWWMGYFNGSNALLVNPQSQLNRSFRFTYVEREIFNSTLNDYVKVKVITRFD